MMGSVNSELVEQVQFEVLLFDDDWNVLPSQTRWTNDPQRLASLAHRLRENAWHAAKGFDIPHKDLKNARSFSVEVVRGE